MTDFAALYPIPFAVAKDRQLPKLVARTERLLDAVVNRVDFFSIRGATFVVPPARFRPGTVLHVTADAPAAVTITIPESLPGMWFDIVNRSAFTATLARSGSDTIDGATTFAVATGVRCRLVVSDTGAWEVVATS